MWKANHRFWCLDPSHYRVVEITQIIQQQDGSYLEDDDLARKQVAAQCAVCGAQAKWVVPSEKPTAREPRHRRPG